MIQYIYSAFFMKKLLRPKDIFLLTLAGIGDAMEEVRDPLCLVSSAYEKVYGFVPKKYKRNNFQQTVSRSLKTGDIEKVVKGDKVYLRLTTAGKTRLQRDFPITKLTKSWNKQWLIVVFDIAEKSRTTRDRLRNKLQSLGFGMLQESVWISPLPIGKDMLEFIDSIGLSQSVFVLEVSHLLLGDPRELARKIWHLDSLVEKYEDLKGEIEKVNQLIEFFNDREKKREANALNIFRRGKKSGNRYRLESKLRLLKRKYLDFVVFMPPLPQELLPKELHK